MNALLLAVVVTSLTAQTEPDATSAPATSRPSALAEAITPQDSAAAVPSRALRIATEIGLGIAAGGGVGVAFYFLAKSMRAVQYSSPSGWMTLATINVVGAILGIAAAAGGAYLGGGIFGGKGTFLATLLGVLIGGLAGAAVVGAISAAGAPAISPIGMLVALFGGPVAYEISHDEMVRTANKLKKKKNAASVRIAPLMVAASTRIAPGIGMTASF